ncbi:MAG: MCE family protein [Nitrospirota bacterium]|nr:MAG: MCE family protein [Nitrospirota bacterium]
MSKKANPTVIGVFVVGAVALVIVGVLLFGGGQFLGQKLNYVLYFEDSLKGLNVGAPVMFRGTKVGSVWDIKVVIDAQDESIRVPVYIELDEQAVDVVNPTDDTIGPGLDDEAREREFLNKMVVEKGLRAQLEMQSLVTGQLVVQLDFFPKSDMKLHRKVKDDYPEFPTVPSSLKEFTRKLEDLPLKDVLNAALHTIESLGRILNSPEFLGFIAEGKDLIIDFRDLTQDLDRALPPIAEGLEDVIGSTEHLVKNVDRQVKPISSSFQEVASTAKTSLEQAQQTLSTIDEVAGKDSQVRYRLSMALKELATAARSVRDLADYLERHPEALLQGKN